MFDSKALLDQFLGSNGGNQARGALDKGQSYIKNNAGGLAGGALAGGLAGYLLSGKKSKKLGKKAVKYGGMALVGGLATSFPDMAEQPEQWRRRWYCCASGFCPDADPVRARNCYACARTACLAGPDRHCV